MAELANHTGAQLPPVEVATAGWLCALRSDRTRAAYRTDLGDFLDWLGRDPLTARRVDVDAYARHLADQGLAPATRRRRLTALGSFYTRVVEDGLLEASPVQLRMPKVESSQELGLTRAEAGKLLAAARTVRSRSARVRAVALVQLLIANGLRVSEALSVDVEQLGTTRGHRVIRDLVRKGGQCQTVPLAPSTARALDELVGQRTTGPIFATATGARMDRSAAARLIRGLGARAYDRTHGPHLLRHTFVSLALDAGVPLEAVQDAAGHADPRTTRRYDRSRATLDGHATYALAAFLDQ